ncbi:hypothetical protein [Parageobacillus sp. KH3-4]|uniref:hypothetical protein n=1 Tax=Parageobacillus sp. KH3-4 TaxID=2916802 RepID=UPI001FCA52BA|nr:hypothetical protein [Parageobacillus sp. KH3-4]
MIKRQAQDEIRGVHGHAHSEFLLRAAKWGEQLKMRKRADLFAQPSRFEEMGKSRHTVVPFPSSL